MSSVYSFLYGMLFILSLCYAYPQNNPEFNVNLLVDYKSAEEIIALIENKPVPTSSVAELRGNKIAASTAGLIADDRFLPNKLHNYIDSLRYNQIIKNDVFHLEDIKRFLPEIKELLAELKLNNFSRKVLSTVEQLFPTDTKISVSIPIYVVTIGHENADAFVRRIKWDGEDYQFVGENEGELTIVINLTQAVKYGNNVVERYLSLLGVVAHEVFHASFSAYKEESELWQNFYSMHLNPLDRLIDLTQNEGIAYYISLDQQGKGLLPRDWEDRIQKAFYTFNSQAKELISDTVSNARIGEIMRGANLSGYWQSYGSITGMAMAREIDLRKGRAELIETIRLGPSNFFKKYDDLTKKDSNLPTIDPAIIEKLR